MAMAEALLTNACLVELRIERNAELESQGLLPIVDAVRQNRHSRIQMIYTSEPIAEMLQQQGFNSDLSNREIFEHLRDLHVWYEDEASFEVSTAKWKSVRQAIRQKQGKILSEILSLWYWAYYVECAKAIGVERYRSRSLTHHFESFKSTVSANRAKLIALQARHAERRLATSFYSFLLSAVMSKESLCLSDTLHLLQTKRKALDRYLGHEHVSQYRTFYTRKVILMKLSRISMAKGAKIRRWTFFLAWRQFSILRRKAFETVEMLSSQRYYENARRVLRIWRSICNQRFFVYKHVQATNSQERSNAKAVAFGGFVEWLKDSRHNQKVASSKMYRNKLLALRQGFAALSDVCRRRKILNHFIRCRTRSKQQRTGLKYLKTWQAHAWSRRALSQRVQQIHINAVKLFFFRWKIRRKRSMKKIVSQDLEHSHTVKILRDGLLQLDLYRKFKQHKTQSMIKARQNEFHVLVRPGWHMWRLEAQAARAFLRRKRTDIGLMKSCWNSIVKFCETRTSILQLQTRKRTRALMSSAFAAWKVFVETNWKRTVQVKLALEFSLKKCLGWLQFGIHLSKTRRLVEQKIRARHLSLLLRFAFTALSTGASHAAQLDGAPKGPKSTYMKKMVDDKGKLFLRFRLLKHFFLWKEHRL